MACDAERKRLEKKKKSPKRMYLVVPIAGVYIEEVLTGKVDARISVHGGTKYYHSAGHAAEIDRNCFGIFALLK
jgi:hypothetical protein